MKQLSAFLRQILLSPLYALRISKGKCLLIVAISYALAIPGLWFLFPRVQNGASMLLPIISASFLFRYRGLLIALVLNVVAFLLVYLFLLPDIVSDQVFVERVAIGSGISLVLGLLICWLRMTVDLQYTPEKQILALKQEQKKTLQSEDPTPDKYQQKINKPKDPLPLDKIPTLIQSENESLLFRTQVDKSSQFQTEEALIDERIGQQFGNYCVIGLLGEGGFAKVYLGEHLHLEQHMVAIKVLRPELPHKYKADFLKEASRSLGLKDPHIVRFIDFGVKENTPFLIMEYLYHGTLRLRHPKGSCLPIATVVTYVKQIANALQYIHEQKLVHRDVKPENMLLGEKEEILLSDFGIMAVAHTTDSLCEQGFAGTVAYMAPEQIQKRPRPASDQYALGVTVYEWLCGTHPFENIEGPPLADRNLKMQYHHLQTDPPALCDQLSTIPPTVESVVLKALAKDPKDRWSSIQNFATALEQASQQTPISTVVSSLRPISLLPLEQPAPPWKRAISTDHTTTEGDTPLTR